MPRRTFNMSEFTNGLLKDISEIQSQISEIQAKLMRMELDVLFAAKMAEPKTKTNAK